MDIYSILSSKPHNPHYLKRYVAFVNSIKPKCNVYVERHHICPKAKDMFPEYVDFNNHEWNKIDMSAREHFIAHKILAKAYPNTSQEIVLYFMTAFSKMRNRDYEISKLNFSKYRTNKSTYKDDKGNKYFLNTDDLRIKELSLVGYNKGIKYSEESKEKLRRSKDKNRTCKLYRQKEKITILVSEKQKYISDGWTTDMTEYKKHNKENQKILASIYMKGTCNYYLNGTYYGKLRSDDPLIEELGLKARKPAQGENTKSVISARKRLKGTRAYNNGTQEIMIKDGDIVPIGFILGGKPRKKKSNLA